MNRPVKLSTTLQRLSYRALTCFDGVMKPERDWRSWGRALEYWVLGILVAGSLAATLWSALCWLLA